ncbi:MAG: ion transporter [Magnetovibrio sp.]|nr:ion transporter [Magnetovibrio sp.]
MSVRERVGAFVEAPRIQNLITGLIVLNAVTLGLETDARVREMFGGQLAILDRVILTVFITEIAAKLFAYGGRFFRDGWNVFDFIVVGIALVPAAGPLYILRALRILRVLRLISVVPQMRRVVQALVTAIPGLLSIVALITLIFYVSAVLATNLFAQDFPQWFGHVGRSMYSLFQIMTLESWSMGIVRPVMEVFPYAWVFFVPFILVTSFAVINLFIGVIVDAMQGQHDEIREEVHADALAIEAKIEVVERELTELRRLLSGRDQP